VNTIAPTMMNATESCQGSYGIKHVHVPADVASGLTEILRGRVFPSLKRHTCRHGSPF
jgi:hypothetical protein